ncbi:MAG: H+/Na+-translocating ferredoxin:NAD+ oxidoreductase subunit [Clostridiales bacterium]|jgi:Na+-translocating ferredoxin:NAD+ oxidoreductase RNF subunit RnfB|nr:H+/Na+-translocating ferredoxin:NAD+ oxidoreductase subunit [Clostridiales bacterium]
MNMNLVILASVSLGVMGLIFGIILAFASKKFAVEVDPRVSEVREVVPGANCGACGYPGCDGFSNAVVKGIAPVNGCPVGGAAVAAKVAKIMGLEAESSVKRVAKVKCDGHAENCSNRYDYQGIDSCLAANMLNGGPKSCSFGCMGLGSCVAVCPFDAIHINDKGLAEVDPEKCTACGKCIETCPKDVISLVPYEQLTIVTCNNKDKGPQVKKNCKVACIACGMCERNCPHDAIHVVNNLAEIDYSKCVNCMICVEKCPTGAIQGDLSLRKMEA